MKKIKNFLRNLFSKKEEHLPVREYSEKKVISHVQMKHGRVMQFKKQQLKGAIKNVNGEDFRIGEKQGEANKKFIYEIDKL